MINLVRNENMKLYGRLSTWVMMAFLIILIILTGFITSFTANRTSNDNWREELEKENESLKSTVSSMPDVETSKEQYANTIKINEYRLEHNIPPTQTTSLWGFMSSAAGLISVISLFTIVIGGGMVSTEFSEGTIKLLLIRPSSRWKILLSKYISTLLATLFMLAILFIISFIVGGILFGFTGISEPYLRYINGNVREVSMVGYVFSLYGYNCVDLIMMATFAFMISTVFRNSSLAIGLAIFLMFTGSTLVMALSKYNWVKYILFANTNLKMYAEGAPIIKGMTLGFSITVLIIYYILFNAISWIGFSKRDITA
ncbi:MAG: DUF2705 family protein [Clostridiales bacterium]|nr:DUF2705 family protein [Clostridiales bacterium]